MNIGTLIEYKKLKIKHGFNDNLAKIILHLGEERADSFRSMVDLGVITKEIRCYRDLSKNVNDFIVTWREGGESTTLRHCAKLKPKGKKIFLLLKNI